MTLNARLAALAVVLLAGSVWAYSSSVARGERFQRGQRLLPNLVPDEVARIEIGKGEEKTTLRKQGDSFTVVEMHDYPAKNEEVNRFIRDLLEIELAKEVGRGAGLAEELGIEPPGDDTIEVALANASGQEMVRLRLGDSFPDGPGRYVRRLDREDAPIYLTAEGTFLSTSAASFLDKEIVDHPQSEVARIEGRDFVIAADGEDGPLVLQDVPAGKREKTIETNKLKSILDRLSFDEVFVADDEAVRDLGFDEMLRVDLDDGTGYVLSLAADGDQRYLRIEGHHDLGRVEISLETPEEELREKADQLTRADEIEDFNAFHGSWVYRLSSFTADKIELSRADLLEDESS
ncbi:MAG: DUF4340 domain-containing protein [Thermoanaerobaculia bacterium]|nr:DUF4340 domain-containing protein [Thermoanaerobaculia bacterium]